MKIKLITHVLVAGALLLGDSITGAAAQGSSGEVGLNALQEPDFGQVAAMAAPNSNAPRSSAPCVRGYAGEFPCSKIDLLSFVPSAELGGTFINDIWGWTDPETGSDYALVGAIEGLAVVDISDPKRPVVLGMLPTHSPAGGA